MSSLILPNNDWRAFEASPEKSYQIIMYHFLSIFFGFFLVFIPYTKPTHAEVVSIDDLLLPEIAYEKSEDNVEITQRDFEREDIAELLGPKDVFPFLPDNHRDSGTGKFNSF